MTCAALHSHLPSIFGQIFHLLTAELEKLSGPLVKMQLVYTFHARKNEYVNNIMVTVILQAAVSLRGSGI